MARPSIRAVLSIAHTVHVATTPGKAFAYAEDLARHVEWQDGLEEVEIVTPGATVEGTHAIDKRRIGMLRMVSEYEITEHHPPRELAFRTLNGALRPEGRMTFEPEDDGARVHFHMVIRGVGLGRLLAPLVSLDARRRVRADLERFAEILRSSEG